jgi:arginyl-tRNA--protein-N-Asp/Glu arginylyltransferase
MLVQYYYPQSLSADRLDHYLADGWFRGANMLYRSQLICFEEELYSVINIRLRLDGYGFSKSLRKLFSRNGRRFRLEIGPVEINDAKERLYSAQKSRFKGFVFSSLAQFLYSDYWQSVFQTLEMRVFDGSRLVAVSYFDVGHNSLASILGLHDEAYSRYSLGLYTMLLEIDFAKNKGLDFYYPGYVLDDYEGFDYKLRLGPMEYYDWHGKWQPMTEVGKEKWSGKILKEKMNEMAQQLALRGAPSEVRLNPFFSVGYLDSLNEDFLQSSLYLDCYPKPSAKRRLVLEYSIERKVYALWWAVERYHYEEFFDSELPQDMITSDPMLLSYDQLIVEHDDPDLLIERIAHLRV